MPRKVRRTRERARPRGAAVACAAIFAVTIAVPAPAHPSDPVRNAQPERSVPPEQIENPIYYPISPGNVGEVNGVAPEALLQDFLAKHSAMNYLAAIEAAMRLVEAVPDRPVGHYNLACALARAGRTDEALAALRDAIRVGWRDAIHMGIDPDLGGLRDDPRFADVRSELDAAVAAERIDAAPLRTEAWETIAADLTRATPILLSRYHVPGASIALIRDGEVVWSAAFGSRDGRHADDLGVEDRFRMRAPLHLMAIAACQRLEEQRKLDLATLIVEAANHHGVPTFAIAAHGEIAEAESDAAAQPARLNERLGDRPPAHEHQAASIRTPMRVFSRNSVYGFLRLAIEDAAAEPFPRFCEHSILRHLHARSSAFIAPESPAILVHGHSALGTPLRPSVMQGEFAPGGCVYLTAGDLGRLIALGLPAVSRDDGADKHPNVAGPAAEAAIFEGESNDERERARFDRSLEMATRADNALSGALGLAVKRSEGGAGVRYQMDEAAAGVVLLARWHPESASGVVVLCNSVTAQEAAERIAHIALGGE